MITDTTRNISMQGRKAWVITSGTAIGVPIAEGLVDLGAEVALIGNSGASSRRSLRISADFGSRAALEGALATAAKRTGPPDLIVHAAAPAAALTATDLASFDEPGWDAACHAALRATLFTLQACYIHIQGHNTSVVGIGPASAFVGAAGLTALSTAVEGQRALFKSAARQWGTRGITLNWISVAAGNFASSLANVALPQVPELGPPPLPLGRVPDLRAEAAPAIAFFASPAGRAITGATLSLDGGEWMLP